MPGVDEQVLRPEGAPEGSQGQTAEPCRLWYSLHKSVRALSGACRNALRSVDQLPISLVLFSAVLLCLPAIAIAKEAKPVEDPQIEQRMQALTQQLRCLVCQNET